jgi:hypothetical protein
MEARTSMTKMSPFGCDVRLSAALPRASVVAHGNLPIDVSFAEGKCSGIPASTSTVRRPRRALRARES